MLMSLIVDPDNLQAVRNKKTADLMSLIVDSDNPQAVRNKKTAVAYGFKFVRSRNHVSVEQKNTYY